MYQYLENLISRTSLTLGMKTQDGKREMKSTPKVAFKEVLTSIYIKEIPFGTVYISKNGTHIDICLHVNNNDFKELMKMNGVYRVEVSLFTDMDEEIKTTNMDTCKCTSTQVYIR